MGLLPQPDAGEPELPHMAWGTAVHAVPVAQPAGAGVARPARQLPLRREAFLLGGGGRRLVPVGSARRAA